MIDYLAKVLYIISARKSQLFFLFILAGFTSVLEALGTGIIGPFLNIASNPEFLHEVRLLEWLYKQLNLESSEQMIPILGLVTIIIFCFKSIFFILTNAYIIKFTANEKTALVSRLLNAYLRAPYSFHLNKNTANISETILVETNQFSREVIMPLLKISVDSIIIISILSILALTNVLFLALVGSILLLNFLIYNQLFGLKLSKWGEDRTLSNQAMNRLVSHSLGGLKETRIIGCESFFQERMKQQGRKWAKSVTLFQVANMLPNTMVKTSLTISMICLISLYQILYQQSFTQLMAIMGVFAVASLQLIPSSNSFMQSIGKLRNSSFIIELIYSDLKSIEDLLSKRYKHLSSKLNNERKNTAKLATKHRNKIYRHRKEINFNIQIDIKNITFSYPNTLENTIKDISLRIEKGKSVALIGKSGSGKTTFVDIVLGLLEPNSGDIKVDSQSIYDDLRSWQNLVAYIPQSIFLLDDTIEKNIAFGISEDMIDPERLNTAIKIAQLYDLTQKLPDGIKTKVGERGVRLSGGQRQRVGIARALYHEREVFILDEATAALDNETEYLVSKAIQSLAGKKTMIIIAHRLSTIEHCDRVYQLDQGVITREGSFQEVVVDNTVENSKKLK